MATNDFLVVAPGPTPNVATQATFAADPIVTTGNVSGVAKSPILNKAWRQSSIMAAVLAQFTVDRTGQNAVDDGTTPTLLANLKASIPSPVIGTMRKAGMVVASASATATFNADQVVVATALNALPYLVTGITLNINLATVGAGGMDTGTAPVSGFVGLYLILNPTTGVKAMLAVNAVSAALPNVYGGVNLPAGYTASALVSVWPTNASSQFEVGSQIDRTVNHSSKAVVTSNLSQPSLVSAGTTVFPKNAVSVSGSISIQSTAGSSMNMSIYAAGVTVGQQTLQLVVTANQALVGNVCGMTVTTAQTIFWTSGSSAGTPTFGFNVTSFTF